MRNPRILLVDRSEELVAQVQTVVRRLRPTPEVVVCERIGAFDDIVHDDGDFNVVVAGPSLANRSGLGRLAVLHTQYPALSIILAFSDRPNANLREIVRTGAIDLLHLPVSDDFLMETIERALAMSRSASSSEPVAGPTRTTAESTVITVASPTGGAGKTIFSINLAYHLRRTLRAAVCIVDLDLEFGRVATALRLRPRYTIIDPFQRDEGDDEELQQFLGEYLVEHDSGLSVLAAPKDPTESDAIGGPEVIRIIQAIRARFDYIILDTPSSLNDVVLSAIDLSDVIYLLSPLDLPNLRTLSRYISTLQGMKVSSEAIRLVLNKEERDTGVDVAELEKLFPLGFKMVLPYSREVTKSLNLGSPVLEYRPAGEFSRRLVDGLNDLVADATSADGTPVADGAAPRRWWKGIRP